MPCIAQNVLILRMVAILGGLLVLCLCIPTLPALYREARGIYTGTAIHIYAGQMAHNLLGSFVNAGGAVMALLLLWFAGRGTWVVIAPGPVERNLRVLACAPLGLGIVGMCLYGLLLVRLWYPFLMLGVTVAAAFTGFRRLRPLSGWRPLSGEIGKAGMWLALVCVALWLPWLLVPETARDCMVYTFAAPAQWLRLHGLSVQDKHAFFHCNMLPEMAYGVFLAFGLNEAPKWLGSMLYLLGVMALGGVASSTAGLWPVAWATTATTTWFFMTGKEDSYVAAYALLSAAFLARMSVQGKGPPTLALLCGLSGGFALSCKLTALMGMSWLPVALVLLGRRMGLKNIAIIVAAIFVPAASWHLKSYLSTGDPIFPVLSGLFPGIMENWDWRNAAVFRGKGEDELAVIGLSWPFGRTVAGILGEHVLLALAIPFLLLGDCRWKWMAVSCLAGYAGCHVLMRGIHARFLFPMLAPILVIAGAELASWEARRRRGALILVVGAGVLFAAAYRAMSVRLPNPIPYLFGMQDRQAFITSANPAVGGLEGYLRGHAVRGDILLVGDDYGMIGAGNVRLATVPRSGMAPLIWRIVNASRNDAELLKRFRQLNAGMLVSNTVRSLYTAESIAPFAWDERMLRLYSGFLRSRCITVWTSPKVDRVHGAFHVFSLLERESSGPSVSLPVLPGTEGELQTGILLMREEGGACRALAEYMRQLERMPAVGTCLNAAGYAARLCGKDEVAYGYYRQGLRTGLVGDESLFGYAVVATRTGRYGEGIAAFERAAETYGDLKTLSMQYALRGRFILAMRNIDRNPEGSIPVLEGGIAGAGNNPALKSDKALLKAALALCYLKRGDKSESARLLAEAGSVDPRFQSGEIGEVLRNIEREWLAMLRKQMPESGAR